MLMFRKNDNLPDYFNITFELLQKMSKNFGLDAVKVRW